MPPAPMPPPPRRPMPLPGPPCRSGGQDDALDATCSHFSPWLSLITFALALPRSSVSAVAAELAAVVPVTPP